MKSIATIDEKLVKYDFIEERFLVLSTPYTGNQPLQPNQRCYFGPNSKLRGKRIIAISVTTLGSQAAPVYYNDIQVMFQAAINQFTLTIINTKKEEAVKEYPISDLTSTLNTGKTRIFNILPDIENSYVQAVQAGFGGLGIIFNFYTTND